MKVSNPPGKERERCNQEGKRVCGRRILMVKEQQIHFQNSDDIYIRKENYIKAK